MLLERKDVNPNQADTEYGRTPLSWAAENGHEGVVKMLLERKDVNPNQADTEYGRTPLSWAAERGHEG
jgi:ankyrin repeat protein